MRNSNKRLIKQFKRYLLKRIYKPLQAGNSKLVFKNTRLRRESSSNTIPDLFHRNATAGTSIGKASILHNIFKCYFVKGDGLIPARLN